MLPLPYAELELKATVPWSRSVKLKLSEPQGTLLTWRGLKFGIQRPPIA